MNNIKTLGKFLDQPLLISKLNKKMPQIMTVGGALILSKISYDSFSKNNDKKEAKKDILKKGIVLFSAIASSLLAPKIAGKITKRIPIKPMEDIKKLNSELIDEFISKHNPNKEIQEILNKAKEKVLSFSEVKALISNLNNNESKNFINKLIPEPENIKAKDIFSEIGFLSIYGAIPVVGGIIGGITADNMAGDNCKKNLSNKISEGIYQYLANIFMCNIGAGLSLAILEKLNIKSKSARAIGMTTGIIATGVLGGSKIANMISKKIIQPFKKEKEDFHERKPEMLDLCLHTDDIATVSLLSGLKWIEPTLPILYSVSGYKAGIGYRN